MAKSKECTIVFNTRWAIVCSRQNARVLQRRLIDGT